MKFQDSRGLEINAQSHETVDRYDAAVTLLAGYFLDPLAAIDSVLEKEPDFVAGHCLRGALAVLAAERTVEPILRESLSAGVRLASRATERELRHFSGMRAWMDGDFQRAIEIYGSIVMDYPRDLLALQVAHVGDFYLGQQRMLRDRVAQILPHWDERTPGYGFVLGMLAFGLEETNLFPQAETTGRRALDIQARDPWAVHAVTHVFEMTGRVDEGINWLESRVDDWAKNNGFAVHNFWHLALFHMENGNLPRVLSLFDENIWPKPSSVALELVDAASMLWRLHLRGVELGKRTTSVADAWSDPIQHGYYAFNDAHATLALVADGRLDAARAIVAELERAAAEDGSNADMSRYVGLPFARAIVAFGEERYEEVVDTLLPLRLVAHQFGGSNAQRDVIEQTLAEAALRAGRLGLVSALSAERKLMRPTNAFARSLDQRASSIGAARAAPPLLSELKGAPPHAAPLASGAKVQNRGLVI